MSSLGPAIGKKLPLLLEAIDLETALEDDENMVQKLAYPDLRDEFMRYLHTRKADIEAIVAYHLGLRTGSCLMAEEGWLHGSFNICIPINIRDPHYAAKRVLFRVNKMGLHDNPVRQYKIQLMIVGRIIL